jgi:DNA-binding MarR family transcriptional regulator
MSLNDHREKVLNLRQYVRDTVCELAGLEETSGPEIVTLIHLVDHACEQVIPHRDHPDVISGPRLGLLMRMYAEELGGNLDGITPTQFSHFQSVSKNTISALLRGLEEQGFVQRTLDPHDLRLFRIQLTPAGRELVQKNIPERVRLLNQLVSGLSPAERASLVALLEKLYASIIAQPENIPDGFPAEVRTHGG